MAKSESDPGNEATATTLARRGSAGRGRRGFLKESLGLIAGAAGAQVLPSGVAAQPASANAATLERLTKADGRPIVLRNGMVLSMDRQVGDFERADVLIQGPKIVSVGPNLAAPGQALIVDAAGMIVMPGMIDTHHHQYQTILRSILADGILPRTQNPPKNNYNSVIGGIFTPAYLPEDARIAELLSSLSQIDGGVTTTVDTSQVQLTPEHTDACIAGLKESGRRALFVYGAAGSDAAKRSPAELSRLRKQVLLVERPVAHVGLERRRSGSGEVRALTRRAHHHPQRRNDVDDQRGADGPRQRIHPLHATRRGRVEADRRYGRESVDRPGHRDADAARPPAVSDRRSITGSDPV